ncbi:MAG TPA: T9SS type A sorting domain-containing protein, partial [Flavobacterium sp.]|nr:T9SS type A sorting domain-containing protein [Flavobacterium sp.]
DLEGTLGADDFLSVPFLHDVITDTHYDYYQRMGRQSVFLGRLQQDLQQDVKGIACNEYVAVCIGTDGIAHVYGDYPNYQEFAYFIQPNCANSGTAEFCVPGLAFTWNYGGQAMKVYKVPGTMNGTNYFDVNNWENAIGSGGSWENWSVDFGNLSMVPGTAPQCNLATTQFDALGISVFPNPFADFINLEGAENASVSVYDVLGKKVFGIDNFKGNRIDTSLFSRGLYFVKIQKEGNIVTRKMIKN